MLFFIAQEKEICGQMFCGLNIHISYCPIEKSSLKHKHISQIEIKMRIENKNITNCDFNIFLQTLQLN